MWDFQKSNAKVGNTARLALANVNEWEIAAGNKEASCIVSRLIETMQFRPQQVSDLRLNVFVKDCIGNLQGNIDQRDLFTMHARCVYRESDIPEELVSASWDSLPNGGKGSVNCVLTPAKSDNTLATQLTWLSLIISLHAETQGGVLLHGALAEKNGYGVILAGHGGAGKTTASQRFPLPWRSLCDDTTLVVCDKQGRYWAHPWPTWSKFLFGGTGGSWDVQHAVPLKGIFFLVQAREDRVIPIDEVNSICLLAESAEQASLAISRSVAEKSKLRDIRSRRFHNVCELAKAVPCYVLRLSLSGAFWEDIEKVIESKSNYDRG